MSIHMATDGAPFPSVEDDLRRQIMGLRASLASAEAECCAREEVQARLIRERNAAEAEVVRLRALSSQPYTPKVGDVVAFWNGCVGIIKRLREGERAWRVENKANGDWWEGWDNGDLRPATPAERAAAGLPPEPAITAPSGTVAKMYDDILDDYGEWLRAAVAAKAPAKPEVLPEHLALLEASAYYWGTYGRGEEKWERMAKAGKALAAAVARRDGGGK